MTPITRSTIDINTDDGVQEKEVVDVITRVNTILGYDVESIGQADAFQKAIARLRTHGETVPAEDVLGSLDEE